MFALGHHPVIVWFALTLLCSSGDGEGNSRPGKGVRLYLDYESQELPNFSMIHTSQFFDLLSSEDDIVGPVLCQSANNGSNIGTWYDPYGNIIPFVNDTMVAPLVSERYVGQVGLGRTVDVLSPSQEGLYKCVITDDRGVNETLTIGIYNNGTYNLNDGPIVQPIMNFKQMSQRLVNPPLFCLSFNVSNGPPTTVNCTIDQMPLTISSEYLSIEILNGAYSVTRITITLSMRQAGHYQCTVSNARVTDGTIDGVTAMSGTSSLHITIAESPSNLTATRLNTGFTRVRLSWSPLEGMTTSYEVFYELGTTPGMYIQWSITNTTDTTVTVTSGLLIDHTYTFSVISYQEEGSAVYLPSDPSRVAMTFNLATLETVSLTTVNSTTISVFWMLNNNTDIIPTNYEIQRTCKLVCAHSFPPSTLFHSVTSPYQSTGVMPYSECIFNLIGYYGINIHYLRMALRNITFATAPTSSISSITISSVEAGSMIISWNEVPCTGRNGPINGYLLTYTNTSYTDTVHITGRQYNLTELRPYTNYTVTVSAYNNGHEPGPTSDNVTQVTAQSIPSMISDLMSTGTDIQVINISWSLPNEPNGIITVYEIQYTDPNERTSTRNTTSTQYSIGELSPNTNYTIRVRAYTSIGPGEWTDRVFVTQELPTVSGISVTRGVNESTLMISWDHINYSSVKFYTVYYYKNESDNNNNKTIQSLSFSNTHGDIEDLDLNTTYIFSISATFNINGTNYEGRLSEPITFFLDIIVKSVSTSISSTSSLTMTIVSSISTLITASTSVTNPVDGSSESSSPALVIGATTGIFVIVIVINILCLVLGSFLVLRKKKKSGLLEITSMDRVDSGGGSVVLFNSMHMGTPTVDNPMYEGVGDHVFVEKQSITAQLSTHVQGVGSHNVSEYEVPIDIAGTSSFMYEKPIVDNFNPLDYEEPVTIADSNPTNYQEPVLANSNTFDYEEPVIANSNTFDYNDITIANSNNDPLDYEEPIQTSLNKQTTIVMPAQKPQYSMYLTMK